MVESAVAPTEIRLNPEKDELTISFGSDTNYKFSAEFLRVHSPSAEVQGHSEAQRKTIGGKRFVTITDIEPVGNYAIKLTFDDGHDTGLFSWKYLTELGSEMEGRWKFYLFELEEKGLKREPKFNLNS